MTQVSKTRKTPTKPTEDKETLLRFKIFGREFEIFGSAQACKVSLKALQAMKFYIPSCGSYAKLEYTNLALLNLGIDGDGSCRCRNANCAFNPYILDDDKNPYVFQHFVEDKSCIHSKSNSWNACIGCMASLVIPQSKQYDSGLGLDNPDAWKVLLPLACTFRLAVEASDEMVSQGFALEGLLDFDENDNKSATITQKDDDVKMKDNNTNNNNNNSTNNNNNNNNNNLSQSSSNNSSTNVNLSQSSDNSKSSKSSTDYDKPKLSSKSPNKPKKRISDISSSSSQYKSKSTKRTTRNSLGLRNRTNVTDTPSSDSDSVDKDGLGDLSMNELEEDDSNKTSSTGLTARENDAHIMYVQENKDKEWEPKDSYMVHTKDKNSNNNNNNNDNKSNNNSNNNDNDGLVSPRDVEMMIKDDEENKKNKNSKNNNNNNSNNNNNKTTKTEDIDMIEIN